MRKTKAILEQELAQSQQDLNALKKRMVGLEKSITDLEDSERKSRDDLLRVKLRIHRTKELTASVLWINNCVKVERNDNVTPPWEEDVNVRTLRTIFTLLHTGDIYP